MWFVNQTSKLDILWGTPQPIQIEGPKYNIIVPVRYFGQYDIKIKDPRLFFESSIGNISSFDAYQIHKYFKGKIISSLNNIIAKNKVSVLDISTYLLTLSENAESQLNNTLSKYGVSIIDFSIMSISVPEDAPSVIKLKEAKALAARLNVAKRDV